MDQRQVKAYIEEAMSRQVVSIERGEYQTATFDGARTVGIADLAYQLGYLDEEEFLGYIKRTIDHIYNAVFKVSKEA